MAGLALENPAAAMFRAFAAGDSYLKWLSRVFLLKEGLMSSPDVERLPFEYIIHKFGHLCGEIVIVAAL